ncbi:MAG: class IV adenylate cyclase [Frankia sp.]
MSTNIETKASCPDLVAVQRRLAESDARWQAVLDQHDTYFGVPSGRLKLRVERTIESSAGRPATRPPHSPTAGRCEDDVPSGASARSELIAYERPDRVDARPCQYWRIPVGDPEVCVAGLGALLGIRVEVRKRRELWIVGATRVHLDRVDDLGQFVELETVLTDQPRAAAEAEHRACGQLLGIDSRRTVAGSYADLLSDDR